MYPNLNIHPTAAAQRPVGNWFADTAVNMINALPQQYDHPHSNIYIGTHLAKTLLAPQVLQSIVTIATTLMEAMAAHLQRTGQPQIDPGVSIVRAAIYKVIGDLFEADYNLGNNVMGIYPDLVNDARRGQADVTGLDNMIQPQTGGQYNGSAYNAPAGVARGEPRYGSADYQYGRTGGNPGYNPGARSMGQTAGAYAPVTRTNGVVPIRDSVAPVRTNGSAPPSNSMFARGNRPAVEPVPIAPAGGQYNPQANTGYTPRTQGTHTRAQNATYTAPINPSPRPQRAPVAADFNQYGDLPEVYTEGPDHQFNDLVHSARLSAARGVDRANTHQRELAAADDWSDDGTGVIEDADDFVGDIPMQDFAAADLTEFTERVTAQGTLGGYEVYNPAIHVTASYPIDFPFPKAYDPIRQIKQIFVRDDQIVEVIKELPVNIEDHIDDVAVVETEGNKRINVMDLLNGVDTRLPTPKNRASQPADTEKGTEAVIATADELAFPTKPIVTVSDSVRDVQISLLADQTGSTVEGFHEKRLMPLYLGKDGRDEVNDFSVKLSAASSFESLHRVLTTAKDALPSVFFKAYEERLTQAFNDMIYYRLGSRLYVGSFLEDYHDVHAMLVERYGAGTLNDKLATEYRTFSRLAKQMPTEAVVYEKNLPESMMAEHAENIGVLVNCITTLHVPFTSEDAVSIFPTGSDERESVGVTRTETPRLVKLIHSLLKTSQEAFKRPADQLRLVTKDGAVYHIHRGLFGDDDTYVLSRHTFRK